MKAGGQQDGSAGEARQLTQFHPLKPTVKQTGLVPVIPARHCNHKTGGAMHYQTASHCIQHPARNKRKCHKTRWKRGGLQSWLSGQKSLLPSQKSCTQVAHASRVLRHLRSHIHTPPTDTLIWIQACAHI